MLGFFARKNEEKIHNVGQALNIINRLKSDKALEKIVFHAKINDTSMNKNNMTEVIKQHFTPEDPTYFCQGAHYWRGKKHSVQISYFNNIPVEHIPVYPSFASGGLGGMQNDQYDPITVTKENIVHKAIIDFYMK